MKKTLGILLLLVSVSFGLHAQVYEFENKNGQTHRILKTDNYLVETIYESDPAKFVLTRGGFVEEDEGVMRVVFEFNSNFEKDKKEEMLITSTTNWNKVSQDDEDMEAHWLFAARVRNGEMSSRRGEESTRKTLKVLLDGHFQWIAYDTNGMKFYGSGGGMYEASDGQYKEIIQYFSKDNSRVGAELSFDYELVDGDWHHKGLSSKGDPIHEIWAKRD